MVQEVYAVHLTVQEKGRLTACGHLRIGVAEIQRRVLQPISEWLNRF